MPGASELLAYGAVIAAMLGVGLSTTLRKTKTAQISRQLRRVTGHYDDTAAGGFWNRFSTVVGRGAVRGQDNVQALSKLLRNAGIHSSGAPYIFAAIQVAAATLASVCVIAWAVSANTPARLVVSETVAGVSLGYLLPRLVLRFVAKAHRRRIHRELPLFIDMLLLLLRTGMGLARCFREIERFGLEAGPAIHPTIKLLLVDLDQGRGYDEALVRWAERMSEPSAMEIARHLQQSLAHGTEVAKALGAFAQRFVEQRLAMARELAGRRSSLVTLVTVGLFLPPLLIVLAAPGFSQLSRLFHR
jgi:tight adherence protein C